MNFFDYYRVAILLYPSKMLYPGILPLVSMFDTLFKDVAAAQRKLKLFWIAFFGLVTLAELNSLLSLNLWQHLFLGDSPGVDVPSSYRIFNFLHCKSWVSGLHANFWRFEWK